MSNYTISDIERAVDSYILEYEKIEPEDMWSLDEIWEKLSYILAMNEEVTLSYLRNISSFHIDYLAMHFDDLAMLLNSHQYIDCLKEISQKFPEIKKIVKDAESMCYFDEDIMW